MKYIDGFRLYTNLYMCIFDKCIALVETKGDGSFSKATLLGDLSEEKTERREQEITELCGQLHRTLL